MPGLNDVRTLVEKSTSVRRALGRLRPATDHQSERIGLNAAISSFETVFTALEPMVREADLMQEQGNDGLYIRRYDRMFLEQLLVWYNMAVEELEVVEQENADAQNGVSTGQRARKRRRRV